MKLLLIEDEKELAISIQHYLTGKDFVCEWADNIATALEKINSPGWADKNSAICNRFISLDTKTLRCANAGQVKNCMINMVKKYFIKSMISFARYLI